LSTFDAHYTPAIAYYVINQPQRGAIQLYYRLHDHCKLVKGAARAAIYDFNTHKVHSINMAAAELLNACYHDCLAELFDIHSSDGIESLEFLNKLTAKELGLFQDHKPTLVSEDFISPSTMKLDFIWLELTSACNSKCLHCYAESGPSIASPAQVPHTRWLSLIEEAQQEGAKAIQFIGGEPLLYPKWRELVVKASELGYEYIEIFTNGTLVDDDCVNFFKQYNVRIATTLYATHAEIHDKITLQPNSFTKTMTAIDKILEAAIPLRIASIIMRANEHEVDSILNLYKELGMDDMRPDVIRPTGRGDDEALLPIHYHKPPIKPPFYTDQFSFVEAHHFHSCLAGKIAITTTGDAIPCIFSRDQICGNIMKNTLAEIMGGQSLSHCWHTTKDQINTCTDCEYRYACSDCRPLAQSKCPDHSWLAAPQTCSYDPHIGQWNTSTEPLCQK